MCCGLGKYAVLKQSQELAKLSRALLDIGGQRSDG